MISVCMTTFNGALHLVEQIESILSQLGGSDELVIADDGSTDGTLNMLSAWADDRIRVLPAVRRLGVVANFERVLLAARGDFIFLCDQDDVWLPNKCVVFMEALGSADLVVSDCCVTDEALNVRAPSFFKARGSGPGTMRNLWRNSCLGCCMAFRREILSRALPFPAGIPMHDTWIGLVANATGAVYFCPQVTLMYRRHGANLSPTSERSTFSQWAQFGHRLRLGAALVVRLIKLKMSSW
jgi:glycosyltransferase involved in cell wall biosynthesis